MVLSDYTKNELLVLCNDKGIEVPKTAKKADIIVALEEHEAKNSKASAKKDATAQKPQNKKKAKAKARAEKEKKAKKKRRESAEKISNFTADVTPGIEKAARGSKVNVRASGIDSTVFEGNRNFLEPEGLVKPGEKEDVALVESHQNVMSFIKDATVARITEPRTYMSKDKHGNEKKVVNASAVIKYGIRTVYIPATFFLENYDEIPQNEVITRMQGRLGSKVDFNVVNVDDKDDPDNPVYLASRLAAMKAQRAQYWYSNRQIGKSLRTIGSVQEARVVAVAQNVVVVEIFGAETTIGLSEVAYEYVDDARNYYRPGHQIYVKIKSVTLADEDEAAALGFPVKYEASIRAVFENPRNREFKELQYGETFRSKITTIKRANDSLTNYYFVNCGAVSVYCIIPPYVGNIRPQVGDEVDVKITGIDNDSKRVWGEIQHLYPSSMDGKARPESFVR